MPKSRSFAAAITKAASQVDQSQADPSAEWVEEAEEGPASTSSKLNPAAQAQAEAAFAAAAAQIGDEFGCAVIYNKPRVGRRRTKAEYDFWRKPVSAFLDFPETLDLGPTALARRFSASETAFAVNKDTMRSPLSAPARKAARELLRARGYTLSLPAAFSIRDVQKALREKRDRADGVQRFSASVEVVGDTVFCNGKSYKMQPTASGKMRIRAGNAWLPVDALQAFLSGHP